ncbi:hypothetical protein EJ05DRAFT_473120 [Pseudovirgaria hyperparasitica]|uniref:SMP-30/Gluconolactonase/LRE-like region domain-containing protein n=1 Tax=Pseudovirgaria hyperparasitica TaxID=470096 RepID=A0A6A6WHC5_9PEZI|nr:uncharacterized protein EJ05DRAFT_473120 [Pseudovirgaria hyperparasitica]KAF2762202.1 hypothetical protein EJ05DRAFT_473120 [Pseudovirgaria hyperparasitica]
MMLSYSVAAGLIASAVAVPLSPDHHSGRLETIYQFPNHTWLESIAVRNNENILTGANINLKGLYNIDPSLPQESKARLIYQSDRSSTFGITELGSDIFAFTVGDFNFTDVTSTPGTWDVYLADLRNFNTRTGQGAKIERAAHVHDAAVLNGLATLDAGRGIILASDSLKGVIWKIDTKSGAAEIFLDDPALKPVQDGTSLLLGINGLKVQNTDIYFTNSFQQLYGRVKLDRKGEIVGEVEILAQGFFADDLDVDAHGDAYIGTNIGNSIIQVTPDGRERVVVGAQNSTEVYGPTSVAISDHNPGALYIATSGGFAAPLGEFIEGGKVLSYDLRPQNGHLGK